MHTQTDRRRLFNLSFIPPPLSVGLTMSTSTQTFVLLVSFYCKTNKCVSPTTLNSSPPVSLLTDSHVLHRSGERCHISTVPSSVSEGEHQDQDQLQSQWQHPFADAVVPAATGQSVHDPHWVYIWSKLTHLRGFLRGTVPADQRRHIIGISDYSQCQPVALSSVFLRCQHTVMCFHVTPSQKICFVKHLQKGHAHNFKQQQKVDKTANVSKVFVRLNVPVHHNLMTFTSSLVSDIWLNSANTVWSIAVIYIYKKIKSNQINKNQEAFSTLLGIVNNI